MSEQNDISVVGTAPTDDDISVVGAADPAQEPTQQTDQAPQTDPTPAKEPEPQQAKEPKAQAPAAPEKYEFAMPEGYVVDEAAMEQITPVLKEIGVSQEAAQKLADFHFAQMKAYADAQAKAREETIAQWTRELKADKDIGGPDLKQNLLYGTRLLNKFGSADLDTLLQQSGLDRNPTMVRFLVAVGREFSEDRWADGGKHGPAGDMTPDAVAKQLFDKTL